METIKIQKDEELIEILKCKTDEIIFARYDPTKDPEATSNLVDAVLSYCQDLDVACMFIPQSDDDVYLQLEQWDIDRLRNFDSKLQAIIRKKSPLILD